MLKKGNKGFTIVELLVVIAIIGILAVVALPALFENINKAKVAKLESDYNAVKSAVLSYYTDKNKLPYSIDEMKDYIEGINSNNKGQIGGIYNLAVKDSEGKIHSSGKSIEAYSINEDGTINTTLGKIKIEDKGDVFLTIQGNQNNRSMFITKNQLKKICNDIGSENIYSYGSKIGASSRYNQLFIKII